MMPSTLFRSSADLAIDHSFGLDCELRPWNESIESNFYWLYENDRKLHFNNPADMNPLSKRVPTTARHSTNIATPSMPLPCARAKRKPNTTSSMCGECPYPSSTTSLWGDNFDE